MYLVTWKTYTAAWPYDSLITHKALAETKEEADSFAWWLKNHDSPVGFPEVSLLYTVAEYKESIMKR